MAIRKSGLYSSLCDSYDELRRSTDASQYRDHIPTLLLIYVSDRYAGEADTIMVVPEGGSFTGIVRLRGDREIGEKINPIISTLAEAGV
jgi:type I restriction enzyme M protein